MEPFIEAPNILLSTKNFMPSFYFTVKFTKAILSLPTPPTLIL